MTAAPARASAVLREPVRNLWRLAHDLFNNDVARDRSYTVRPYQVKAAVRAVLTTLAGRNAGIELPTGTGKTLIACMAAVFWKRLKPASRVLLIVPSRTLVVQHFDVARWVAQTLTIDRLTDDQSGDPGALRQTLLRGDLIISTPGLLASAIERGVADDDVVTSFDLVIVDEFDQFVVADEANRQSVARYTEAWRRLSELLPAKANYLVKSATLGLDRTGGTPAERTNSRKRPSLAGKLLDPVAILVPERSYAAVVPSKPVLEVQVIDPTIAALLKGVSVAKGMAHLRLDEALGPVDYADVERRAPQICQGPMDRSLLLQSADGGMITVRISAPTRGAFCGITKLMMMPQHIVEDLTLGLDVEYGDCMIETAKNSHVLLQDVAILRDDRVDDRFRFQRGGKIQALGQIVAVRSSRGERGVVFVRTVTLLEALKPLLASLGLPLFELTGEMADHERRQAVSGFRASANGLLLMTRTTGGRGLDLPFAHYAVFYSPKSKRVTMWQEMSRIRSTVSMPKDIYVLCYGVEEATKLGDLLRALKQDGRRVLHQCVSAEGVGR